MDSNTLTQKDRRFNEQKVNQYLVQLQVESTDSTSRVNTLLSKRGPVIPSGCIIFGSENVSNFAKLHYKNSSGERFVDVSGILKTMHYELHIALNNKVQSEQGFAPVVIYATKAKGKYCLLATENKI